MLSVSHRLQAVQPPVIPIVAALIRDHPGTISLGQGVVNYLPPEAAAAALRDFFDAPDNHQYKPVDGIPQLRELITEKLAAENGIKLDRDNALVVTAGGNMAFLNALLAIADPGDEVILQTPYYFNHEMAVTMANCRPVLVPTDSRFQPDLEKLRAAITPRTRALVTVSPNNPTGAVYPEPTLRAINELCRTAGIYHIHDEAYEYFTWEGVKPFSPGSIHDSAAHTISLFSLSKAFGFASWRIGYQVIPVNLLEAVKKIQDTNLICPPVISQFAAAGALQAGRAWCEPQLRQIEAVREIVARELSPLADLCEVPPAAGAFYFFLKLATRWSPMRLVEALIREHRVAAIPGDAFGLVDGCAIRISYGALTPENAREGMRRLTSGLRTLLAANQGRP
ncbi:MAG TPA: pyridoxal phosphate-dependent aminotransferase [Verrucomicrobiae bacterium]|nr:pyridoxal phosphate-dependent aminotransferase [Verrucomicrobiae bacterium]